MKILKQIDENTRIIQKNHSLYGWMVCYQIKKWYGYKTILDLFTGQCASLEEYEEYFDRKLKTVVIGYAKQF